FFQTMRIEDVLVQYAVCDIAWISPSRDGLNLVAKEYVATQGLIAGNGVLILSSFAGASVELTSAVSTNPYDHESRIESLLQALVMDAEEAGIRIRRSQDQVQYYDIHYWGKDFVKELERSVHPKRSGKK